MFRTRLFPFALLALSQSIAAQQPPSAGSQIQQIPPAPTPQRALPQLSIVPSSGAPDTAASDSVRITVHRLQIAGASAYPESDLVALTGFKPGSELTLADLRGMAARIADRYRSDGYFLAQAYLPAQDVKDGVVTIAVLEGRYGRIVVRNSSNLADARVHADLGGLDSGAAIAIAPLESRLLLLSDIPGVNITSTLAPGASLGASDLIVDVVPGQRVTGSIDADNAGNRYTGPYRVGATLNLNNPTGRGDVASLRVLTSGAGLSYARASYQTRVGKASVGVAYSGLRYQLGREFESLRAHGSATIASVYASYPLLRSRSTNLYAQLAFDAKTFRDRVDSASTAVDKKAHVLMPTLRGDHQDNLGGGGSTVYSLTGSVGNIDIATPSVRANDAATARSNGRFAKLGFSVNRLQRVTESVSLFAALSGQMASKNLDVSEKMELGGVNAVRAYPEGEAYADQGQVLTLEARVQLPRFSERIPGQMQLIGFFDVGRVTLNKSPWGIDTNHRTLSGAGVGLDWSAYGTVVKVFYALKVGGAAAQSAPDSNARLWVQAVKYF